MDIHAEIMGLLPFIDWAAIEESYKGKKDMNLVKKVLAVSSNRKITDPLKSISLVESALRFRGVSVASDEALCIATLMQVDLSALTCIREEDHKDEMRLLRMKKVWELIATEHGVPSSFIFSSSGPPLRAVATNGRR